MRKRYVLGLMLLLGTQSCNDQFLEQQPVGAYNDAVLQTPNGIKAGLIAAYSLLNGQGGTSTATPPSQLLFGTIRGGESHKGSDNSDSGYMLEQQGFEVTTNNTGIAQLFQWYYNGVDRANTVLRNLPHVVGLSAAETKQIEAEAKFLRGHYYFFLKRVFKNIPFVDEKAETVALPNTAEGGNYVSIWPNIKADFDFARKNLNATTQLTGVQPDWGRPNNWAAEAYYAKVLLYMGNEGVANAYAEALTVFTNVVNNGKSNGGAKYALNPVYYDLYNGDRENALNVEYVWDVQHTVNDGTPGVAGPNGNQVFPLMGTQVGGANSPGYGAGYGWVIPTQWFTDHFRVDADGLPIIDNAQRIAQTIKNDDGLSGGASFTPDAGLIDPRLDWTIGRRGLPFHDYGIMPGAPWIRSPASSGNKMQKKYFIFLKDKGRLDVNNRANAINLHVIRYADVLLMAAELEARIGSIAQAFTYVNMIRNRMTNPNTWVKTYVNNSSPSAGFTTTNAANYKIGLYPSASAYPFDSRTNALKAILFERTLELGQEGHRAFDVIRFGQASDFTTDFDVEEFSDYLKFEQNLRPYLAGKTYDKPKDAVMPIPQQAVDNSFRDGAVTLKQNPGY